MITSANECCRIIMNYFWSLRCIGSNWESWYQNTLSQQKNQRNKLTFLLLDSQNQTKKSDEIVAFFGFF